MFQIYLVGAHGHKRMPEFLAGQDVHITLICCAKNALRRSKFVDTVVTISNHGSCESFAKEFISQSALIEKMDGWVIFNSDEDMYQVANSHLSTNAKLKLLPVRNVEALRILGSKHGLVEMANETGIQMPRSLVANTERELQELSTTFESPFIVKGSRGAGGKFVRKVETRELLTSDPIPADWFPVIIQEFIDGDERAVEALFKDGELLAWIYSDQIVFILSRFGPTSSRRYIAPKLLDFQDALVKFGRVTKAHGFGNCAFMFSPVLNKHFLVEVDLRTNEWHQFGLLFGINWTELMRVPITEQKGAPRIPNDLPEEGVTVRLWQREIEQAIYDQEWRQAFILLKMKKRERSPYLYKDLPVNRSLSLRLIRLVPIALMKTVLGWLPASMGERIKKKNVASRIASQLAGG